jgi:hypothetical protein
VFREIADEGVDEQLLHDHEPFSKERALELTIA